MQHTRTILRAVAVMSSTSLMGVYVACYRPNSTGDDAGLKPGQQTPATVPATVLPGSKSVGAMLPGSKSNMGPIMAGSKSSTIFSSGPSVALPGSIGGKEDWRTSAQTRPASVEPLGGN